MHVYTSFTCAGLSRALTLAGSLRRFHPDWTLWAVLVDRAPMGFDESWRGVFDFVLDPETLYGTNWRRFAFKHDVGEACAAVKGRALLHLLGEGAEKAIYLDPDIALFDDLNEIERRLDSAAVLLSPHQVAPNATLAAIADNEAISMKYGVYNLGFLGVRNDANGAALARWWVDRLDQVGFDEVANGIFLDQKYFDLVPGLFDGVEILRDPGCHVASWNLSRRTLAIDAQGRILVNGRFPLRFYHFTKEIGDGDLMTERYAGGQLAVFEIGAAYERALAASGAPAVPADYWAFGRYDDGETIQKAARVHYRGEPELFERFADPFATGEGTYREYLAAVRPDLL